LTHANWHNVSSNVQLSSLQSSVVMGTDSDRFEVEQRIRAGQQ